jgi:O-antigen/teichoic acid export membrane protein
LTGRLTGASGRRVMAGLSDQALVAVTTAGLLLAATWILSPGQAGPTLYAAQIITFLQGAGRAVIGDVLLTHAARLDDPEQRRQQFNNAHATGLALAGLGMLGTLPACLLFPKVLPPHIFLWGWVFIPAILLQDLARYTYQALRDQQQALAVDLAWVGVQLAALVVVIGTGAGGGPVLACWGLGAAVAVTWFYLRTGLNPLRGRPMGWLRDTRRLLGWYTATGLLAQTTTLLIGTLVQGLLTSSSYAGFRVVNMLVLQPAQSLAMALNGLLVPRSSRLAGRFDVGGLNRQTRQMLAVTAATGLVIALVATVGADPVLTRYNNGMYAAVIPIALPIGLQTMAYLMQVPLTVAIRGMQHGQLIFLQYLVFSVTCLTGLVSGAWVGEIRGAAWGLCCGSMVGLLVQGGLYLISVARLSRSADRTRPTGADPEYSRSPS